MSRAKDIKWIVIHATAGFQNAKNTNDYFLRPKSDGGRGWNTGGYREIIELDGKRVVLYPYEKVTNGVEGFNKHLINISYVGGVEKLPNGKFKSVDTRTNEQKRSLIEAICEAKDWIDKNGGDSRKVGIVGHYDFSPDQNKNGIIEPFERIKDCPCFNARLEYASMNFNGKMSDLPKL